MKNSRHVRLLGLFVLALVTAGCGPKDGQIAQISRAKSLWLRLVRALRSRMALSLFRGRWNRKRSSRWRSRQRAE